MNLDTAQKDLLARVTIADRAYRAALLESSEIGKLAAQRYLADRSAARDMEVRRAYDGGVPGNQIHKIGLSTTARKTLDQCLERTANLVSLP